MLHEKYQACIDACNDCAVECEHCAIACLGERNPKELERCIKLDMDCSLICSIAAKLMARGSEEAVNLCGYCAEVCRRCAEECRKHEQEHCQRCADACDYCADEC